MPRKPPVPPIPDQPAGRSKPPKPSRGEPEPRPAVTQLDLWAAFAEGWERGESVAPSTSTGKPKRRGSRGG